MRYPTAIRVSLAGIVAAVVAGGASAQTTWYVDDDTCPDPGSGTQADPFCSIQDAIDIAVGGDAIEVAPGIYFETFDFLGKAVTLYSTNGPAVTIIDAQGAGSVVTCTTDEGPDTVLSGFTLTNGNGNFGGGMLNQDSSPTVTDCTFSNNTAGNSGGGMHNHNGNPTVTGCTFSGNSAIAGAGMNNSVSSPTVTDCTFTGNTAGPNGGGMVNTDNANPSVTDCTFSDNSAMNGGGMYNYESSPTVAGCAFGGNTATNQGGGMYTLFGIPTVTGCAFSGNDAPSGGGMYNIATSPDVTNCTFSGNTATNGGGMCNETQAFPTVAHCTFSLNSATSGGGMYSNGSGPKLINCILWGDNPTAISETASVTTVIFSDVEGGWAGAGNVNIDPMFVGLPGSMLHLSAGSPCIDAGITLGIDTDFDGNQRAVDDPATAETGTGCGAPVSDMGAFEFGATPPCPADVDRNGIVNINDFLDVLAGWGCST